MIYGFLEPKFGEPHPAATFTATAVPCDRCHALAGDLCDGPRIHPDRIKLALRLMRQGQLPEAPQRAAEDAGCSCGTTTNQRGRPLACADATHRCIRTLAGGERCRGAVVENRVCVTHVTLGRRWNESPMTRNSAPQRTTKKGTSR